MSEPSADREPATQDPGSDRLDVADTAAGAVDLGAAAAAQPAAPTAPDAPQPGTRAARRALAEQEAAASASVLDHPAALPVLSVLLLVAAVVGVDQATQGRWFALLPAVALAALYVIVVRRRRARG